MWRRLVTYTGRVILCALALIGLLFTGSFIYTVITLAGDALRDDYVVEEDVETPGTWREGYCIWICEPLGGEPLDHRMSLHGDDWLCWCEDGHMYLIP